ncbi:hypothetical protein GQ42DRAFT_48645 [Ramicandelaber brevisporus]|nr:hypothetical protein GQ42DRAFT_48645 [Ramicandelaber brevisporus]
MLLRLKASTTLAAAIVGCLIAASSTGVVAQTPPTGSPTPTQSSSRPTTAPPATGSPSASQSPSSQPSPSSSTSATPPSILEQLAPFGLCVNAKCGADAAGKLDCVAGCFGTPDVTPDEVDELVQCAQLCAALNSTEKAAPNWPERFTPCFVGKCLAGSVLNIAAANTTTPITLGWPEGPASDDGSNIPIKTLTGSAARSHGTFTGSMLAGVALVALTLF